MSKEDASFYAPPATVKEVLEAALRELPSEVLNSRVTRIRADYKPKLLDVPVPKWRIDTTTITISDVSNGK